MCLRPITIINPSKYVSLRYRERYLIQVPCGQCAQCMTNKANEWYFRSYYETLCTLNSSEKAFILFDTLTYNNENLPHISDFVDVPKGLNFSCFNAKHVQLFNKRLRKKLEKYDSKYKFFLTSEYGTSEGRTHRPHYHLLVYCDGNIEPVLLSQLISECWNYGRTDGIKYKPYSYVMHNVFDSHSFADSLRTCRYVSKYIQKSSKFQQEINNRIDRIMLTISEKMPIENWIDSPHAKRVRSHYMRIMNQFHRQSIGFGAGYLNDADFAELCSFNQLKMPDSKKVVLTMPLPTYYKRKLFYETIKVDGNYIWIPTELGQLYLKSREAFIKKNLVQRYQAMKHQLKNKLTFNFDVDKLADYVLNYRGRIRAVDLAETPLDKLRTASIYNYSTLSDREHLRNLGLSTRFCGNNSIGYRNNYLFNRIKFKDFIDRYVIIDNELEAQLKFLIDNYKRIDDKRQEAFELRQRLTNLYHHIGLR